MTTPVNFRVKNGLTVANGVAVTQGNVTISNGSLVIGATAINATSISGAADNAYANGVNYTNGKAADAYGNAVAVATDLTNNAYSNAVTFAANADNLTSGTLSLNRLPATVNVVTALNVSDTVSLETGNVSVTNGNDIGSFTASRISFTDSLTEASNTYYAAVSHDKLITSKNYSVANVIYADYGEISRTGMFSVVGLDTTNTSIYVRGVTVNTSVITIGNTTVYSLINSTAFVGNGTLLTSVNAATVGGNSASDLRGYTETYASNATNITSGTVNSARLPAANATVAGATLLVDSVSNTSTTAAASAASVKTAYDAAITANTNAASALANASTAYTNAINIAANATNLTSGTVNIARIPVLDVVNNTSISYVASANSVKTAYDAATNAYSNAVSYTDGAISAANVTGYAAAAYTNAITIAANATNLTSGTVNIARIPTVDAVNNTSITLIPVANNVKTAYDAAIAANTLANTAATSASAAYTNAIAIAANATNLTSGTVNSARLPSGNSSTAGAVVLVDSVSNTSTTAAATAASVKTAYDAAITANTNAQSALTAAGAAYTNAVSYTDTKIGTANTAMAANAATAYSNAVSYVDGKIGTANSAITGNAATAYTNAVSYTDGKILTANGAITGNAATAYTNSVSYTDTKIGTANTAMVANASAAYTNAIAIAANASNLTSGTVAFARLPTVDSVANTSVALVPTANNVKTAYDAAITANTNAQTALTAAGAAYTNAVSYTDTKIGTANTAMAANAATAYTNAVSYTDTKIGTANTAMVANAAAAYTNATVFAANASNANNGTLAEARLPYRMNQNLRTSDSPTFANGSFTGSVSVGGDLTITGNLISTNVQSFSVSDPLIKLGVNNPSDTYWGGFTFHYSGSGNTTNHAGLVRSPTSKEFILMSTFGDETAVANNNTINIADASFSYANLTVNLLKAGNATVFSTMNTTSFSGVSGFFTGTVNAASYTVGTSFVANTSGITASGFANVIGGLSLSNSVSNFIDWSTAGVSGPSINTRSPGTKLLLYPSLSVSQTDYAMGISPATMWSTVPSAEDSFKFKWYGADIEVASISGAGNFKVSGYANVGGTIQGGSSLTIAGAASGITTLATGNTTITGFVNATSSVNSAILSVGSNFVANATHVTIGNGKRLHFLSNSAATGSYFELQGDNNLVLYTTNTSGVARPVFNVYANSNASTQAGAFRFNTDIDMASLGIYANNSLGTSGHVLHSNGTSVYWAADDQGVTSVATANGLSGGTITSTGTLGVTTGSTLTVNSTGIHVNTALSIDQVFTSNNGGGTNVRIGDDAWFGDVNVADSVRIMGQQSANNGYIIFGNENNAIKLGRAGAGPLTWNSNFAVSGTTTLSANLIMANNNITNPVLTGYTEHEVANTSATGSYSLDCAAANFWDLTLTGNITIAPTNVPPSTRMWAGTIVAKQDATGGRTITWPTGSKYPGGVAPPATTTANAIDIWSLMTYDGGTSWIVSLTVKGAA